VQLNVKPDTSRKRQKIINQRAYKPALYHLP
jgi:hypothetical protein